MSPDSILEVDNVWKLYPRSPAGSRARLRQALARSMFGVRPAIENAKSNEIWAVRGVNFNLKRGDAMGVIGFNGAGKTTLLRMLAGQILPDRGEIRVRGESAAIIALTAGMQTSASGRANIILRSAMLGRSREQALARMDEIIDFAELRDAIDAPISTYSSGMMLRLAFAVTIFMEPDLLLIDETLSVGDFRFRQKCLAKIREIRNRSAFVLVSHSMGDITRFCTKAILLEKGQIAFSGDPKDVVARYMEGRAADGAEDESDALLSKAEDAPPHSREPASTDAVPDTPRLYYSFPEPFHNGKAVDQVELKWLKNGQEARHIQVNDAVELCFSFRAKHDIERLILGCTIMTRDGNVLTGLASDMDGNLFSAKKGETVQACLRFDQAPFNPGRFLVFVNIRDGVERLYRAQGPDLVVKPDSHIWFGAVTPGHQWIQTR